MHVRTALLLTLASCAAPPPQSPPGSAGEPSLVVGHSPTCQATAEGHDGAPSVDFACVVEPTFDPRDGQSNLSIRHSAAKPGGPTLDIIVMHAATPRVGIQPPGSFVELAKVAVGDLDWTAGTVGPTVRVGTFTLSLTAVRPRRGANDAYEQHGSIDAKLVQDAMAKSTGYMDLHVEF